MVGTVHASAVEDASLSSVLQLHGDIAHLVGDVVASKDTMKSYSWDAPELPGRRSN